MILRKNCKFIPFEKIFDLAVHGAGAVKIAKVLIAEKVPTPGWLNFKRYGTFANIYAGSPVGADERRLMAAALTIEAYCPPVAAPVLDMV